VNGFQFAGPGIVIREWPLRGVAVCPYGADMNTRSELAQGESIPVTFTSPGKEPPMSERKSAEAAPPIPATAPAVDAPKTELAAEAPKPGAVDAAQAPAAPPAEPGAVALSDARAECKAFLDAFGPKKYLKGAVGFTSMEAEGTTFNLRIPERLCCTIPPEDCTKGEERSGTHTGQETQDT
jgi:hypothetical protein